MRTAKVSFLLVVSVLSHLLFGKTPIYLLPQNEVVVVDKAGNSVQMFVRSEGRSKTFIVRTEGSSVFEEFENQGKIDSFLSKYHYFNQSKEQFFYANDKEFAELSAKKRGVENYTVSISAQAKNVLSCASTTTMAIFSTLHAFVGGAQAIPNTAKGVNDLYKALTYKAPEKAQADQNLSFYANEFFKNAYEDQNKAKPAFEQKFFTGTGAIFTMIIPGAISSVMSAVKTYPEVRQACGLSTVSLQLTSKESL